MRKTSHDSAPADDDAVAVAGGVVAAADGDVVVADDDASEEVGTREKSLQSSPAQIGSYTTGTFL
jgi:hypothetical protein